MEKLRKRERDRIDFFKESPNKTIFNDLSQKLFNLHILSYSIGLSWLIFLLKNQFTGLEYWVARGEKFLSNEAILTLATFHYSSKRMNTVKISRQINFHQSKPI